MVNVVDSNESRCSFRGRRRYGTGTMCDDIT